jgi:hypothetical protein
MGTPIETLMACRKGGIVSPMGVYVGFADKLPLSKNKDEDCIRVLLRP